MTTVRMFVNGQALSGGSLNDALEGARLIGEAKTAPRYRFYTVRDEFPGLHPVASGGVAVPGEVYEVSYEVLREKLLPREPSELELTVIELEDGSGSFSMKMRDESVSLPGVSDISDRGGWIAYLEAIA
ncbi:gamma-glutamylcyclotransferase [Nocardia sp. NPDC052112]|uniref:allophanate hydrolase-related protein n=1 Tax=Nocardia sp. NPDC052112 TaxID=3155646 RepID=UPI00343ECBC9